MQVTIIDSVTRHSKQDGAPYVQAACKCTFKSGPSLFVTTLPAAFAGAVPGEVVEARLIFGQNGSIYVTQP